MKKNYLLKTKTYFFYIIYTFILILNRHHYYLIIIDTHRNVCSLEISSEDGNELKNIKFSFDKKFKENLKNNIEETIHVILNRIIEYNPIEDNEKVTYKYVCFKKMQLNFDYKQSFHQAIHILQ